MSLSPTYVTEIGARECLSTLAPYLPLPGNAKEFLHSFTHIDLLVQISVHRYDGETVVGDVVFDGQQPPLRCNPSFVQIQVRNGFIQQLRFLRGSSKLRRAVQLAPAMNTPRIKLERIDYTSLNSRQQETYNFQKVSGVLADFGFATIRLSDDWQGADFIANHIGGQQFLKVQLKGRLTIDQKYTGKDIWICFRHRDVWYLYPHDRALDWALENKALGNKPDIWKSGKGAWSYPSPPKDFLNWLASYALTHHSVERSISPGILQTAT